MKDIEKFLEELAWIIHSPYLEGHVKELRIDRKVQSASIELEDGMTIYLSWNGEK